ncbi:MAG: histidine kinase N-terminal 7TM domain-containing protein [Patescibacteria group bacterium]|nr:histidine kinase N-terminal 7TM domain-containing protein [Patescibacteria group bacterium]MDD4304594.1 histidine kinase N-terminal 7TM domain-containing protein [Patescibacteria group bacterium]MDD4695629.1 histidine kinase N-terminal 7TM domain-containing protein [Patescibacteria group bacterium]
MVYLKFFTLLIVFILDLILGIFLIWKNKSKDMSKIYFGLVCISGSLWSLFLSFSLLTTNSDLYFLNAKLYYFFATLIFIFFYYFSIVFLYKKNVISEIITYFILLGFILVIYVLFFDIFLIGVYFDKYGMHEIENKFLHLLYGFYILFILFISYVNLFVKYKKLYEINKGILFWVLISTLASFIFAIFFSWYLPHINKHYLDWIGPIFAIIMNFSIGYSLFRKY